MDYFYLLSLSSHKIKGIGQEPNEEVSKAQQGARKISSFVGKRDEYSSFPKGLPRAFVLNERE